jgi:hypothetical protein
MIVGHMRSYEDVKDCGNCGNDLWLVDEVGEQLWWVCNRCGRRVKVGTLKGRYPYRMIPGLPEGFSKPQVGPP